MGTLSGFYINDDSIGIIKNICTTEQNRIIFATENQAISHGRAAAQLSQLMQVYNDGWVADWSDLNQPKYCIIYVNCELRTNIFTEVKQFLNFKTQELAEEFLENFKDIIDSYHNF